MSDYGSIIIATKKDNSSISSDEMAALSSGLKKILDDGSNDYANSLGDDYNNEFEEEDANSVSVVLSEYYYGDGDDTELFDFVKDCELDEIQELSEKLSAQFSTFTFKAKVENW